MIIAQLTTFKTHFTSLFSSRTRLFSSKRIGERQKHRKKTQKSLRDGDIPSVLCLADQLQTFSFVHHHLTQFRLVELESGLTLNHFTCILRGMIKLQQLYVCIRETTDTSFAEFSLVEDSLPSTIVEFHYAASFSVSFPINIETELNHSNSSRFKIKIYDHLLFTIPWLWSVLPLWVPLTDYDQAYQRAVDTININPSTITDKAMATQLEPWLNVTDIVSKTKLSSLTIFQRLKTLKTNDASVVQTPMPLTLRSLTLTGTITYSCPLISVRSTRSEIIFQTLRLFFRVSK